MATYSVNRAKHATLTASTIDQVTVATAGIAEVMNRTGSSEIYFTVGTVASPPADPTVGGDDCFVVPATLGSYVLERAPSFATEGPVVVKLISVGTPGYSVVVMS